MKPKHIPIDRINELVRPDFEAGKLYWRKRPEPDAYMASWNRRYAGREVGPCGAKVYGGTKVRIEKHVYYLHRLIFALATGQQPEQIDHIDGDRGNNALSNLRAADYSINTKNKALYKNNEVGEANISIRKDRPTRYHVAFKVNGKKRRFGSFAKLEDAIAHRDKVKCELGYHQNHGRVA